MIKADGIRCHDYVSNYSYGVGDLRNNARHGNVQIADVENYKGACFSQRTCHE